MNKRMYIYFLLIALAIPHASLFAGALCCKQRNARGEAIQEFKKAVDVAVPQFKKANVSGKIELFKNVLKNFYDMIVHFKKEDNNPERFIRNAMDPELEDYFFRKYLVQLYDMGKSEIVCGSPQELIYRLFEFDPQGDDIKNDLFKAIKDDPRRPKKKISFDDFMAIKYKEKAEQAARARFEEEKRKNEGEKVLQLTAKQQEEDDVLLEGLVKNFKTAMDSYEGWYGWENVLEQQSFNDAFDACFAVLEHYKKTQNDPERFVSKITSPETQGFLGLFKSLYSKNEHAFSCGSVEEFIYELFECERGATQDQTRVKIFQKISATVNKDPKKPYAQFLELKKKIKEKEKRKFEAIEKQEAEDRRKKEDHAALMLAKQKAIDEEELQRSVALKIAELERIKADEQAKAEAARAETEKTEREKQRKENKQKRKVQKKLETDAFLKELADKQKAKEKAELAQLAKAIADKKKKEEELQQQALQEKQKKDDDALAQVMRIAAKEQQLKELEDAWKTRGQDALKRKTLKQWNKKLKQLALARKNENRISAMRSARIVKNAFQTWRFKAVQQKDTQQKALLAAQAAHQFNVKKRVFRSMQALHAEKSGERAQKIAFEKGEAEKAAQRMQDLQMVSRLVLAAHGQDNSSPDYLKPLVNGLKVEQEHNSIEWLNDHLKQHIDHGVFHYLTAKSGHPMCASMKINCVHCAPYIDTRALIVMVNSNRLHWSDFARDKRYEESALALKEAALERMTLVLRPSIGSKSKLRAHAAAFDPGHKPT